MLPTFATVLDLTLYDVSLALFVSPDFLQIFLQRFDQYFFDFILTTFLNKFLNMSKKVSVVATLCRNVKDSRLLLKLENDLCRIFVSFPFEIKEL